LNKLTTPVRRFCQAILRQYPLMKKELAALEEEKQAIAEKCLSLLGRNLFE